MKQTKLTDLIDSYRKACIQHGECFEKIKSGMGSFIPNKLHDRVISIFDKIKGSPGYTKHLLVLLADKEDSVAFWTIVLIYDEAWVGKAHRKKCVSRMIKLAKRNTLQSLGCQVFLDEKGIMDFDKWR